MPAFPYEPGQLLPGTVYRVIRHLATGGMGSVYDVEDTTVEKRYVLKTLHPQLVSREDLARRMRDEARSLAKLQHPNIVDVITAGVTSDALRVPFYVMERLIGQNLRVVLEKKSALEITHCYRIAIDVADALEHAHENNLVHRDVKPENIFLHRNASGTTMTKLLDFGIVRLLDRKASHTQGKFIGTLRYASPEQITGGEIGPKADIYALGVVLFEMLCGRGPFDEAGDQYAIGAAHAAQKAPPLSSFVRAAPALERLVASMLAKDPGERPRDCFVVASELRRMLREEEASPRCSTEVNVLSEAASAAQAPGCASSTSRGVEPVATTLGMPSPVAPVQGPSRGGAQGGPVSPIAPTVAAAGLTEQSGPDAPRATPPVGPAPRVIDREAPTRASAPVGATQRIAHNDTRIEAELAHDDVVREAFGEPAPLVVPPLGGSSPPGDIVFPPMRAMHASSVTGPLSGESNTRPHERGPVVLIVAAGLFTAVMVGLAYLLMIKPWERGPSTTAAARAASPSSALASATGPDASPGATEPSSSPPPVGGERRSSAPVAAVTTSEAPSTTADPSQPVFRPSPAHSASASTTATAAKTASAPVVRPKASSRPTPSGYSPAVDFE